MAFTDDDRMLLDLEAARWRSLGEKDAALRDQLNLTLTTAAQRLVDLLDEPEAWAYRGATMRILEQRVDVRRRQASWRRAS